MQQLPSCSVIIPTYNYGHWIESAIDSVVTQDYPNKRIVVIDDNSTDDTEGFFVKREHRVLNNNWLEFLYKGVQVLYSKNPENYGPSKSRNIGIKAVWDDTHVYAMLDADDYWLENKLSKSMWKIIENPEHIGVVYTDNFNLQINTGIMTREFREPFNLHRLMEHNMVHSGSVISKLAFAKCGLYDENLRVAEDLDRWLAIAHKFIITHIPEALVVARISEHNTTSSINKDIWQKCWQTIGAKLKNNVYNNN